MGQSLIHLKSLIKSHKKDKTGLIKTNLTWRGHGNLKYATWNVRGLSGKEEELEEEIEKAGIAILGITETKKKGTGCITLKNGGILIYSGTGPRDRAKAGVAFMVTKPYVSLIKDWLFINERLATMTIEEQGTRNIITVVVAYSPNEDACVDIKDTFYLTLQKTIDDQKQKCLLMGDFNGRVGNDSKRYKGCLGRYGEPAQNNNGKRLLEFCLSNNLTIINTKFPHKKIHLITRAEPSKNEESIIDYILIPKSEISRVRDVRVKRGAEIGSDHYLLVMTKSIASKRTKRESYKTKNEKVCSYKLRDPEVQKAYQEKIALLSRDLSQWENEEDLENAWKNFKNTILQSAADVCGKSICGGRKRKVTRWWTDEIKNEVKLKKGKWKVYLTTKLEKDFMAYKQQRTKVKVLVKKAKQKAWEEFGKFIEENAQGNQKLFYKVMKNMRKQGNQDCPLKFIKDKKGKLLSKNKEIMDRWREYFSELLNKEIEEVNDEEEEGTESNEERIEKLRNSNEEGDNIKIEELRSAIAKTKLGKSAGADGITPEMIKYMGPVGEGMLHLTLQLAWTYSRIPKDWELSVVIPIFKKGDNRECGNHRGVSLLSIPGKIYSSILEQRLRSQVETQLDETQCGFRPNRGTHDAIFTLRQISEKAIEYNREVHLCFIDLEKAFDRLPWKEIWKALRNKNLQENLIMRIQSFYRTCRNVVRTSHNTSKEFLNNTGVRQGDIMSPLLFILVMDDIIKSCKPGFKKYRVGHWKLKGVEIETLAYADDLILIADCQEKLQYNLDLLTSALEERKMKISLDKTKTMVISRQAKEHLIRARGKTLEQVSNFTYLGVEISQDGKCSQELNTRTTKAGKLFNAINRKFLSKQEVSEKTKLIVYKSIYTPILTYGCESWALTSRKESRIQAAEMRFLRKVAGKTRRDRVRNTTIRASMNIEPLSDRIQKAQLRWFGHTQRMGDERYPKQALEARCQGTRPRGRRRTTWADNITSHLRAQNITWSRAMAIAKDREAWKSFCKASTPQGRRGQD